MSQVVITRTNGNLGRVTPSEDAVICLVMSGAAVSGKLVLNTAYRIFGTAALTQLGITQVNNPLAYKDITDFYSRAGEGAELNIMIVAESTLLNNICDGAGTTGKKLIDSVEGRAVIFMVNKKIPSGYTDTTVNGFYQDVWNGIQKTQLMAAAYDIKNQPFVAVLPGLGWTTATLTDVPLRSTLSNDFVALTTYCEKNDGLVSMGLLAGWLAKHQVHQNVGRVASGKVSDTAFMPDGTPAKDLRDFYGPLETQGIIYPKKYGTKAGYFFNDDPCLTSLTSDYSSISWNRVINKAKRIATDVLTEKLNDEVAIDPATGKIETTVCSDWESDVENAIKANMMRPTGGKTAEIGGIKCTVDPDSDIANDIVSASIQVVRKGQAKNISVTIGYAVTI